MRAVRPRLRHHALALLLILPGMARASDGYFSQGYGVVAKGMGGAGIAYAAEALSIAANPAAASWLGDRAEADLQFYKPIRGAAITGNSLAPDASYSGNGMRRFVIPEAAVTYRLSPHWATGVALYGNGGLNTKYGTNPYERFGGSGTAGANFAQAMISPTLSYRFAAEHSIGLSLNIAFQQFETYGLKVFSAYSQSPEAVSNRGVDNASGLGVRIGYLGRFTPWLAVGAMWQSVTYMDSFRKYSGLLANGGNVDIPSAYGIGFDVTPVPDVDFVLDVEQINFHDVNSGGDPIGFLFAGRKLGAPGGPGFGWRDCTAIKLGVNWHATRRLQLRVGYNHASELIPESPTFFNIVAPGVMQHQWTAGASWALSHRWQISGAATYSPSVTVDGASNSIPAAFGGGRVNLNLGEIAFTLGGEYRF